MKINGKTVESRGIEEVYIYGDKYRRTVYCDYSVKPAINYVKLYGEVHQVYRMMSYYTNNKAAYDKWVSNNY